MRYYSYLLAVLFFNHSLYAVTLSEQIDGIIAQELPHATVGVLIKEADTRRIIYSRNADKLLAPASSIKLFTAAAALYYLKPDFRFLTTLSQKDHNYYLTFTGSPSFTLTNLNDLLVHLKKNKSIKGNVVIDSSQYQAPYYPSGTSYDDLGWYYSAPDTAAIVNGNKVSYDLVSAKELGSPALIKSKTMSTALTVLHEVSTVDKKEEKDHCSLHVDMKPNNTIRLFGCVAQTKNPKLIELALPDPILFIKQEIKKILSIELKGQIINGIAPSDASMIASFQSPHLTQLVTHMLRESDNLYANSLTKKLGYSLRGKGTHKEGAFAIKKILSQHTHVDFSQIELIDGEGTRYNLATPEQIVLLLDDLYQDKTMQPILFHALPKAGVSGTLKDRMKNTALEKKIYAKTGTMHDISSLSGFMIGPHDKTYIFSIIINGINKPINKAKTLEEKILAAVQE